MSGINLKNTESNYSMISYHFKLLNTKYVELLGAFGNQFIAETKENTKMQKGLCSF